MCWWIFGHCWHKIEDKSKEVKIRNKKCKCKKQDPFIYNDQYGSYIVVRTQEECCECGKRRYYYMQDYNPSCWNSYVTPNDKNEWKPYY